MAVILVIKLTLNVWIDNNQHNITLTEEHLSVCSDDTDNHACMLHVGQTVQLYKIGHWSVKDRVSDR